MIRMRFSVGHSIVLTALLFLTACHDQNAALREVDALIAEHQTVQNRYQARLDSIHAHYSCERMTDEERFERYGQFFDMYRGFNLDSQLVYVQKRLALADHLAAHHYMQLAQMNRAEVMMRSGMYHEALGELDDVSKTQIVTFLYPYYYHLRRTLYGLMEDF